MGTQSITNIYQKCGEHPRELLCTIYGRFDGYYEHHGRELAAFLASRPVVNGIGSNRVVFNGGGCLAAQVIAMLKRDDPNGTAAGGYYLEAPRERTGRRDGFVYEVTCYDAMPDDRSGRIEIAAYHNGDEPEFCDAPSGFAAWLEARGDSDE
jgi:hypothetical protein